MDSGYLDESNAHSKDDFPDEDFDEEVKQKSSR